MTRPLATAFRWAARIWTLALAAFVVLQSAVIVQERSAGGALPPGDAVELGLLGIALLALFGAWRWERAGTLVALLGTGLYVVAFRAFYGQWLFSLAGGWIVPALFVFPAFLFLCARTLSGQRARP